VNRGRDFHDQSVVDEYGAFDTLHAVERSKIGIVGSGAVGLYYGARLAAAGGDVGFLMRGGADEALRKGIRVGSAATGDIHLAMPKVFRTTAEMGVCDLVIVAVKATSSLFLPELIAPLLHSTTAILTLQNGLGNEEFLAQHFGSDRVLGGLCFVCLTRLSPAHVMHVSRGSLSIGEFHGARQPRTEKITRAFEGAGIVTHTLDDLACERWRKLVWNIPFNGLAVTGGGLTTDRILGDPGQLAECRALMLEVIGAAQVLGHPIEDEYADVQIRRTQSMGPYSPSTLTDWRAGNPLEIEAIWGEPLRRAEAAGVAMPRLRKLYEQLCQIVVRKSGT